MRMTQTEILHMRVSPEIVRALDNLRKLEDDFPTRTEMVRRLVERARDAAAKEAKRK